MGALVCAGEGGGARLRPGTRPGWCPGQTGHGDKLPEAGAAQGKPLPRRTGGGGTGKNRVAGAWFVRGLERFEVGDEIVDLGRR